MCNTENRSGRVLEVGRSRSLAARSWSKLVSRFSLTMALLKPDLTRDIVILLSSAGTSRRLKTIGIGYPSLRSTTYVGCLKMTTRLSFSSSSVLCVFCYGSYRAKWTWHQTCETHQPAVENLPDVKGYSTRDLFLPHPTKKGLWRVSVGLPSHTLHMDSSS